MVSLMVLEPR